jgi:diguanylate cyclase (GGDEF)-like protein
VDSIEDVSAFTERGAFHSIAEASCVLDGSGTILTANRAWHELALATGAAPSATCEGANYLAVCNFDGPGDEQAKAVQRGILDVLAGRQESFAYEYPCHSNQERRWYCARVSRFFGAGPGRAVVAHEDVTAKRQAEVRSVRTLRLYSALSAANNVIARAKSRDQLVQQVCDIAVQLDEFRLVAVRLVNQPSGMLVNVAFSGDDQGYFAENRISLRADDPDGAGPIATALREGREAIVQDLAKEVVERPALGYFARAGIRSSATFPLFVDGEVIGAFSTYSEYPDIFEPQLLDLLRDLAHDISLGLKNLADDAKRLASEYSLHRHVTRADLLMKLGSSAFGERSAGQLMADAVKLACQTLGFGSGVILELAPDGYGLLARAAHGWNAEHMPVHNMLLENSGEVGDAFSQLEPVIVEDFSTELPGKISKVAVARTAMSSIAVAIPGQGVPYGVLAIYDVDRRKVTLDDSQFLRSIANLVAAAIHRDHAAEHAAHAAQFDAATGLPNPQLFRDRLGQAVILAKRKDRAAAVLYISLNRFRVVNETFGHRVGDQLLIDVAGRLAHSIRSGDSIGRLESDVFGVVLADLAKVEDAVLATQNVIAMLDRPFSVHGENLFVTVSVGIALYPGNGEDQDTLLKNSCTAMHRVTAQSGSGYQFYTAQMNATSVVRLRLEAELRTALERDEFELFYQPKIDIATGKISGAEALLRWRHAERGLIPPNDFISILEETGLMLSVGTWVLKTACEQMQAWTQAGLRIPHLSINVSPRQFQQPDFAAHAAGVIIASGVDARHIELEITESMLMVDPEHAAHELKKLQLLGVEISVDDFGTGYSSLSYLKRFPLNTLKIDIAFIRDCCTDADSAAITLAIINLAHNLRLKVVAEGVETEPQFNFLSRHGCDQLQGYLFSRPIEAAAFALMASDDLRLNVARTHRSVQPTLLIVGCSDAIVSRYIDLLDGEGYRVFTAETPTEGFEILSEIEVEAVISGNTEDDLFGIEFLSRVRQMYPQVGRVIAFSISDSQELADAVNAAGIHKSIINSWPVEKIRETIRAALPPAS